MNVEVRKWIKEDRVKFLRKIDLREGQTVLDFGCGEEYYAVPAAKVARGAGKVYALDKDKSVLNKLGKILGQNKIENIGLINDDSSIPLKDNSVDGVLCYDVIHYGDKKERKVIYDEVYRVLKKQCLFSVYPKHHKRDFPLRQLAGVELEGVIKEVEEVGFVLEHKFSKRLLHDEYYNEGYILNFRKY